MPASKSIESEERHEEIHEERHLIRKQNNIVDNFLSFFCEKNIFVSFYTSIHFLIYSQVYNLTHKC